MPFGLSCKPGSSFMVLTLTSGANKAASGMTLISHHLYVVA
jgi:hypothetical protein